MLFYLLTFVYLADKLINNSRYLFYIFKHLFKTSMDLNVMCTVAYTAEDFKLCFCNCLSWPTLFEFSRINPSTLKLLPLSCPQNTFAKLSFWQCLKWFCLRLGHQSNGH